MRNKPLSIAGAGLVLVGLVLILAHVAGGPQPGKLDLSIETKPTVMTVAYKAYGNAEAADGRFWLAKMVMHNSGEDSLRDLSVSYRVPGLIEWTTPDTAAELLPGQTAVLPIYPRFPSRVAQTRSRTPQSLEIKMEWLSGGEAKDRTEKRDFELRGVTEIEYTSIESSEIASWYDMWSNADLLAAYVTDEDPVVKAYFGKISETMGGTPYVQTAEQLGQLLGSIYNFQVATGMVYMGAKGVPEVLGDTNTLVQSIKLPRAVIQGNTGTCIELTILMSALLNQCGVKSHLVLIPGHTFPIIELPDGQVIGFETTGIGGANLGGTSSFEEALKAGNQKWAQCQQGETPYVVIDYQAMQAKGIRPPELPPPDAGDLEEMLAKRVARAREKRDRQTPRGREQRTAGGGQRGRGGRAQQPAAEAGQPRRDTTAALASYQDPSGVLRVHYPRGWTHNAQFATRMHQFGHRWFLYNVTDPQTGWGLEVYRFPTRDQQTCLNTLIQFGSSLGMTMRFNDPQQVKLGGETWNYHPIGIRNQAGATMTSHLYLWSGGQGTYAFSFGGPNQTAGQVQQVFQTILNNIEIREQ